MDNLLSTINNLHRSKNVYKEKKVLRDIGLLYNLISLLF